MRYHFALMLAGALALGPLPAAAQEIKISPSGVIQLTPEQARICREESCAVVPMTQFQGFIERMGQQAYTAGVRDGHATCGKKI